MIRANIVGATRSAAAEQSEQNKKIDINVKKYIFHAA
jgi:hypothetical protein